MAEKTSKLPYFSRQPRRHINEDFVIVWLNTKINTTDANCQSSIVHLQRIVSSVSTFTDTDQCYEYLTHIKNGEIFMIVSDAFNEHFMSLLPNVPRLNSIYIFRDNNSHNEDWIDKFYKVKGVFTRFGSLCDSLRREIHRSNNNLTTITVIKSSACTDSNELNQSFMYTQLLKEILLQTEYDNQAKEKFLEYCHCQYAESNHELRIIEEFEQTYDCLSSIRWYTRGAFIYWMLNKALRTQNVEVIIKMGFFVRDLHRQIERLYLNACNSRCFTVYRGQGMLKEEVEKIIENKDGLLFFNNFLSTSTDLEVAMMFAESARTNPDLMGVIFRMEINSSITSFPFASLDNISYYSYFEKEILFSMHTVFRIVEIKQINDSLWEVDLTLTTDNDQQLLRLAKHMRRVTQGTTVWHRLGWLMIQMGEYDLAEDVHKALIEITNKDDWQELVFLHHQLGYILKEKGDLANALSHYRISLDRKLMYLQIDDPYVSLTFSNIGTIYRQQGNLNKALEHFQQILKVALRNPQLNQQKVAIGYNNIGSVLRTQGKYAEALECYEHTLRIYSVHLPNCHPLLGITYNNIAIVQQSMKDYSIALPYFKKTLELFEKSIPPNHPLLAVVHVNMAKALKDLHRLKEAVGHASLALDIYRRAFGDNHTKVSECQAYLQELRQKR
jgi:tetratricopeptide (TPR) repeat protein